MEALFFFVFHGESESHECCSFEPTDLVIKEGMSLLRRVLIHVTTGLRFTRGMGENMKSGEYGLEK